MLVATLVKKSPKSAKSALPDLSSITTDGKTYLTPAECRKSLQTIFKKYELTQVKLVKMLDTNGWVAFHGSSC